MKLLFTPQALVELDGVLGQIREQSPQGAKRVQQRIKATIDLVARHPHAGQRTNVPGLRRIVVTPFPYLIFYQPGDEAVVVIGVRHAARDPESMPGG